MVRRRSQAQSEQAQIPQKAKYIRRKTPVYELLSQAELDIIENNAEQIGEEIGIEFRDDLETLQIWQQAGATIEGELVKFPRGLLRKIIQGSAPTEFIQHARNPDNSVAIGGDNMVFVPNYGSPFVSDMDNGRRYATIEDFQKIVKLTYMSPWIHHSGGTVCEPTDIAVNKRHLDMVYAHLKYSDKPFMGSVTSGERAQDSIDMAKIVFGDEFVENNCVMINIINVNSPLVYDLTMLDALKVYAKHNQCAVITPFILTGAMGPVTIEAAISQALIEAMAGVALTQLINPGCPVIMGTFTSSMSLKSGAPTFGMPEPALAYLAMGQLARRLGVPLRGGGSLTASKTTDYQAGQESSDTMMPTMLAGINVVMHSAGWLEGGLTFSYEKFLLDSDHLGMMHAFANGLNLDDNHLAMDAYREIGAGHHYLGCAHTMENYKTALFTPELSDSESFEQWEENGSQDAMTRSNVLLKKILAAYQPPPIASEIDEKLQQFIADKKASIPDALS